MPAAADTVVTLVDAGNAGKVIAKTTLTGTDNTFNFDNIAAGSYKLKCTLPGNDHAVWSMGGQSGDFTGATVIKATRSLSFDIHPAGAHVSGLVHRPDGSAVSGVTVVAKRISITAIGERYEARTQSDGTYCFGLDPGCGGVSLAGTPLPADTYVLCAKDTDINGTEYGEYCAAAPLTAEWFGSLSGQDLEVPQDFGWPIDISGRVTMSDGSAAGGAAGGAASGATVEVTPESGGAALTVTTDADGKYKVDGPQGLKTGAYTVCARDKDSNRQCYSGGTAGLVSVTSHSATANINIVITPAPVAIDTAAGPVSGAGGAAAPVPASVPATSAAAPAAATGSATSGSGAGQPGSGTTGAGETTPPASPGSGTTEPAPESPASGSSSGGASSTPAPPDAPAATAPATAAVIPPNVKVTS